jgi:2'-5' RNA ligase
MTSPITPDAFDELLREVMADAERFGHRQHVRLTWLAVRRHGATAALDLVGEGIRRTATKAGAPQKFHVTMTRAWVELVAQHADGAGDFEEFTARHPELLDRDLLTRHYRPETLADVRARTAWVEPDLSPFPWAC